MQRRTLFSQTATTITTTTTTAIAIAIATTLNFRVNVVEFRELKIATEGRRGRNLIGKQKQPRVPRSRGTNRVSLVKRGNSPSDWFH